MDDSTFKRSLSVQCIPFESQKMIEVVKGVPVCKQCNRPLPRPTNDPCREPTCAMANLSLSALWKIIEHRSQL